MDMRNGIRTMKRELEEGGDVIRSVIDANVSVEPLCKISAGKRMLEELCASEDKIV